MRKVNRNGEGECFQVNGNVKAIYDEGAGILRSLSVKGNEVLNNDTFRICIQPYHAKNSKAFLDISSDELNSIKPKVVTTSAREVLEEWLRNNQNCGREIEGRLIYY
jgi:5'-nucleotidase